MDREFFRGSRANDNATQTLQIVCLREGMVGDETGKDDGAEAADAEEREPPIGGCWSAAACGSHEHILMLMGGFRYCPLRDFMVRIPGVLMIGGALVVVPLGMGGIPLVKLLFFALAVLCGTGLHSPACRQAGLSDEFRSCILLHSCSLAPLARFSRTPLLLLWRGRRRPLAGVFSDASPLPGDTGCGPAF